MSALRYVLRWAYWLVRYNTQARVMILSATLGWLAGFCVGLLAAL